MASNGRVWTSPRLLAVSAAAVWCVAGMAAQALDAQLVTIKTVPVASGEQFRIFPSSRPGMGNVSVAVVDSIGDPFHNPALGARLVHGVGFGAPVVYGVEQEGGSGQTLPLGALLKGDRWFGGIAVALQQISAASPGFGAPRPFAEPALCLCPSRRPATPFRSTANRNLYATGSLGVELEGGLSLGFGASFADLTWMAGIEHLYAGSTRIDPNGTLLDLRLGFMQKLENGGEFEGVFLRSETDMRHNVLYQEWFQAGPDTTLSAEEWVWPAPILEERSEENLDRTTTWGGQLAYRAPVVDTPWQVGAQVTVNRKNHPKIPNYEIQNIPRDPGESWAFQMGLGAAWSDGGTTFGADVLIEPIWSNTWQEADTAFTNDSGRAFGPGDRTIENDFTFTNATLRVGLEREWRRGDFQFGVEAKSIAYDLQQDNRVDQFTRSLDEAWIEWSPTWSASLDTGTLTLRYAGELTTGSGVPGLGGVFRGPGLEAASPGIDIIAAPAGPLTLREASVWTHQVMVTVPLR